MRVNWSVVPGIPFIIGAIQLQTLAPDFDRKIRYRHRNTGCKGSPLSGVQHLRAEIEIAGGRGAV